MAKISLHFTYFLVLFQLISCGPAENPGGRSDTESAPEVARPPVTGETPDPNVVINNYLRSQVFRTRGSVQISYADERKLTASNELPSTVHSVPNPTIDIDALAVKATLPDLDCGLEASSVKERSIDCKNKNPTTFKWLAKVNGISGEGDWQLVMKSQQQIVWQDLTTGLIWSDQMIDTYSWAAASGNDQQNNPCSSQLNPAGLGNISAQEISWRLPTRNDFLMADINGARFVLSNIAGKYWSASAHNEQQAWVIEQSSGILSLSDAENAHLVRCVGVALK